MEVILQWLFQIIIANHLLQLIPIDFKIKYPKNQDKKYK